MNQHATSGPPPSDVPELPFAEQARELGCGDARLGSAEAKLDAIALTLSDARLPGDPEAELLETGRVLDYRDKSDDERKLCSLYLSVMDRMRCQLPRFGDAQTRLSGL